MEVPSPAWNAHRPAEDYAGKSAVAMEENVRDAEPPLLPRVAQGDAAAARACIERYGPLVFSMARRFFPSEAEVEDATQDVFLELWRCAARYDASTATEAAFVVIITRRRLIDRKRSRKRDESRVDIDDLMLAAETPSMERYADGRAAARVMEDFNTEQRNALVLFAVHGMAHQEIANELEMPLGTFKSHIRRGLSVIRQTLLGNGKER